MSYLWILLKQTLSPKFSLQNTQHKFTVIWGEGGDCETSDQAGTNRTQEFPVVTKLKEAAIFHLFKNCPIRILVTCLYWQDCNNWSTHNTVSQTKLRFCQGFGAFPPCTDWKRFRYSWSEFNSAQFKSTVSTKPYYKQTLFFNFTNFLGVIQLFQQKPLSFFGFKQCGKHLEIHVRSIEI